METPKKTRRWKKKFTPAQKQAYVDEKIRQSRLAGEARAERARFLAAVDDDRT